MPARHVICASMAAARGPQMLTANRLIDGEVIYWRQGGWVAGLAEGDVFDEPAAAEAALEDAQSFLRANKVVDIYLFAVRQGPNGPEPIKEREIIRAGGPTVRRDLGKQAVRPAGAGRQKSEIGNWKLEAGEAGVSYEI